MKAVVLILPAFLTFASWVNAVNHTPFPKDDNCAEESYTGEKGTIDYPGGGKDYDNNLNCLFKISVPQGHHVDFSFSRFEFEEVGKECRENYDWLKFIDGNEFSEPTNDFCSNGPDPLNKTFSSRNNEITLWMFSDEGTSGKGFKLDWTSTAKPVPKCGCNDIGTEKETCENATEKCKCKPNYTGEKCEECKGDYWNKSPSTECKKCDGCDCKENETGTCNKANGKCICSSAATFAFDKTIVLFTAFFIFLSHQY